MNEVLRKFFLVSAASLLFLSGCADQPPTGSGEPLRTSTAEILSKQAGSEYPMESFPADEYWPVDICRNCHGAIFEEYAQSMHAKSFTNPVFQAQYFNEVVPLASRDAEFLSEAKSCIACHAPIAFKEGDGFVTVKDQADQLNSGVTCDFCHTISGYDGESPGDGNYISTPSKQKLGPFECETYWHHAYSELQTKSEFCAICHNDVNQYGLEIKSTYTEWKESRYAEEGIQCQDCHMTVLGFLTAGKPAHKSGKASQGTLPYSPYRETLYTHRFPGAHSKMQVVGALTLEMVCEKKSVSPGDKITIDVLVDNSRTGHKMPSGSADLRLLWLDVRAISGDSILSIPAVSETQVSGYDISGLGPSDSAIIRNDVPTGSRMYRAIYVDKTGAQTLSSYEAVKISFDNRLDAAEIRKETYHFKIPDDAGGKVMIIAQLKYLPYPSSFSKRFGLLGPEAVIIASDRVEISID